ncbi:MAG: hypothetical protein FWG75_05940 [Cystobacterineae bacterium]|nr:hypothetical protein [Cystobacterineae bacterium]
MDFTVAFWDDGPGIVDMSVGVPEVFSLNVQGPSSMLPAFSVPVVGRALKEGAAEAQLGWIDSYPYTLAPSGQVEIKIEDGRIVGQVAEHNLSFSSARTLGCMVRGETIPNNLLEDPVGVDGTRTLSLDKDFASPQCAALKAMLP